MRDDFHSAAWVDNHKRLGDALHDLIDAARQSMEALTRQQFAAPWRTPQRRRPSTR